MAPHIKSYQVVWAIREPHAIFVLPVPSPLSSQRINGIIDGGFCGQPPNVCDDFKICLHKHQLIFKQELHGILFIQERESMT